MLLLTDLCTFSLLQFAVFVGVASGVIIMECVLAVVRVQDYYKAKYVRLAFIPYLKGTVNCMALVLVFNMCSRSVEH